MRLATVAVLAVILISLGWVSSAGAVKLKTITVAQGCKYARQNVAKWASSKSEINDWKTDRCYRRDRYRIVMDFTVWWTHETCRDRIVVRKTVGGRWLYNQYMLRCD